MKKESDIPTVTVGVMASDLPAIELAVNYLFQATAARHHRRTLQSPASDGCLMKVVAGTNGKTTTKIVQLVITGDEATFRLCTFKVLTATHRKGNLPMHGYSNGRRALRAEGTAITVSDEDLSTRSFMMLFDQTERTLKNAAADLIDFIMQGARKATPLYREVFVPATMTSAGPREIGAFKAYIPQGVRVKLVVVAA